MPTWMPSYSIFDISPDLSLHLEPVVSPKTSVTPRTYGLNCSLKF